MGVRGERGVLIPVMPERKRSFSEDDISDFGFQIFCDHQRRSAAGGIAYCISWMDVFSIVFNHPRSRGTDVPQYCHL